jgi:hypothetical protein
MRCRIKISLIVISLLISVLLSATQANYLITINSELIEDIATLKRLDLPVYHVSGENLIVECSDLRELSSLRVPYRILDDKAWSGKYYLISTKDHSILRLERHPGRILYQTEDMALIKTAREITVEETLAIGQSITEMKRIRLNHRYEKIYPNVMQSYATTRPEIQNLLNEINPDSLGYFVQTMEDFVTRYCLAPNRDEVANWIRDEFIRFGFTDVVIDSFSYNNTWQKNVVATLPGNVNPDQNVIIGGHHDSIIFQQYGNPMFLAPGADDNASGAGAALEVARAMKAINFQPETTIKFVTFGAEELGLHGSHNYASRALIEDMNIKIMINNDMIGYTTQSPDNWQIHLIEYTGYENHANFTRQIMQQYTSITPVTYSYDVAYSDSYSFWIRGFPPIFFIETIFSPYYHTPNDLVVHMNMDYATETVRASAAVAALINAIPDIPEDLTVQDAGNGSELIVNWSPVLASDIDFYEVHVGLSSGNYQSVYTTQESGFVLSDLNEGTTYYVGVSSVGTSGYGSSIIESTGTPRMIPLTPVGFADEPGTDRIELVWQPNNEVDLAGYKLYRSEIEGELGEAVHSDLLVETNYQDFDSISGNYYYYSLAAVDESGNESEFTNQIRSRLVSLDQGILLVADTAPGNGSFQNPGLDEVNAYYDYLLEDYSYQPYNLWDLNSVKLADIGAYSTIIWHKNNASVSAYSPSIISEIEKYLDFGGNILVNSYLPLGLFSDFQNYPHQLSQGDFLFDYFKIESGYMNSQARFNLAVSQEYGYPDVNVDVEKAPAGLNYHIFNIESITANPEGINIYSYGSDFGDGEPGGSMNDMSVGVQYDGEDFKTVLLSFPLFYMEGEESQQLIDYVLSDVFEEELTVGDETEGVSYPKGFYLHANYPNPFNPDTSIRFTMEKASNVNLSIYNMKGQLIANLVDEVLGRGDYNYSWTGTDSKGYPVASGVYFYRLDTGFGTQSRKMLLLK